MLETSFASSWCISYAIQRRAPEFWPEALLVMSRLRLRSSSHVASCCSLRSKMICSRCSIPGPLAWMFGCWLALLESWVLVEECVLNFLYSLIVARGPNDKRIGLTRSHKTCPSPKLWILTRKAPQKKDFPYSVFLIYGNHQTYGKENKDASIKRRHH